MILKLIFLLFSFSSTLGLPAVSKSRPTVRVYGGDDAAPGQFPFIVSLEIPYFGYICGGSIINENWIVTAAHCMSLFIHSQCTVRAGSTLLDTEGTVFQVSKIILYPGYNGYRAIDDIALVKIDGAFEFDDFTQTIEIGQVAGNDPVTVIGWGDTEEGLTYVLQYANLTALSNDDCMTKSEGGDFVFPMRPGQVCALASKGIAPCAGDSGAPLIFNGTLVGILSYFVKSCAKGYPDVYTRPSYYVDWINETIKNN